MRDESQHKLLAGASCFYTFRVEPTWLEVTTHRIGTHADQIIKVAQLSDLHLQKIGKYEIDVIATIRHINPDLIILCGDIVD